MEEQGFCAKDNQYVPLKRGCRHPQDYCPHRSACLIYFFQKEHERGSKESVSQNAHPSD